MDGQAEESGQGKAASVGEEGRQREVVAGQQESRGGQRCSNKGKLCKMLPDDQNRVVAVLQDVCGTEAEAKWEVRKEWGQRRFLAVDAIRQNTIMLLEVLGVPVTERINARNVILQNENAARRPKTRPHMMSHSVFL